MLRMDDLSAIPYILILANQKGSAVGWGKVRTPTTVLKEIVYLKEIIELTKNQPRDTA